MALGEELEGWLGEELEANRQHAVLAVVVDVCALDRHARGANPEAHINIESAVMGWVGARYFLDENILHVLAFFPLAGWIESFRHFVVPVESVSGPLDRVGVNKDLPVFSEFSSDFEEEADLDFVSTAVAVGFVESNRDHGGFVSKVDVDASPVGSFEVRALGKANVFDSTSSLRRLGRDQPHVVVRALQNKDLLSNLPREAS